MPRLPRRFGREQDETNPEGRLGVSWHDSLVYAPTHLLPSDPEELMFDVAVPAFLALKPCAPRNPGASVARGAHVLLSNAVRRLPSGRNATLGVFLGCRPTHPHTHPHYLPAIKPTQEGIRWETANLRRASLDADTELLMRMSTHFLAPALAPFTISCQTTRAPPPNHTQAHHEGNCSSRPTDSEPALLRVATLRCAALYVALFMRWTSTLCYVYYNECYSKLCGVTLSLLTDGFCARGPGLSFSSRPPPAVPLFTTGDPTVRSH